MPIKIRKLGGKAICSSCFCNDPDHYEPQDVWSIMIFSLSCNTISVRLCKKHYIDFKAMVEDEGP